mmetsp:Transcript_18206/g.45912  ORF Transcript_18206/g.45912 Transcript_18206/m.45912 type:complete len:227 (+) Transcript_18206:412-1092(+)
MHPSTSDQGQQPAAKCHILCRHRHMPRNAAARACNAMQQRGAMRCITAWPGHRPPRRLSFPGCTVLKDQTISQSSPPPHRASNTPTRAVQSHSIPRHHSCHTPLTPSHSHAPRSLLLNLTTHQSPSLPLTDVSPLLAALLLATACCSNRAHARHRCLHRLSALGPTFDRGAHSTAGCVDHSVLSVHSRGPGPGHPGLGCPKASCRRPRPRSRLARTPPRCATARRR